MVVCQYFLRGTCKFGTYCRNQHQAPSNYANYESTKPSTSILRQTTFNAQPAAQKTGPENFQAALRFAVHEVTGAEKGGQWLFSTFAPFKEKPAFPGFEDHSQEEIRLAYYEAVRNGTVDQYKQQLQQLYQTALLKVRALQNPSEEVKTILHNMFECPPSSCSGTYGQNSISTTVSAIQQPANIFASSFGQPTNSFGSNPQPAANIFASSPANNPFGAPQTSTNIFATQSPQTNIFGAAGSFSTGQNVPQQSNMFASSAPTAESFANPMQQSGNIFATATQNPQNVFAQNAVVEQKQAQNVFAAPGPQQSLFGAAPSSTPLNAPPANYSASIFGQPQSTNSAGVSAPALDAKLYSDPAELSEKEKGWFASDALDIMNIPDKPPSYNMCFG
ncbi:hypothetical protein HUJ04_013172 [Dendroctonus ponderosae]